jgi:hypothetical protein
VDVKAEQVMEFMGTVEFGRAAMWLRGLQLPNFDAARFGVETAQMNLRLAEVLRGLEPEVYEEVRRDGLEILQVNGNELTRLQQAAMEATQELFPLAWTMVDEPLNYEGGELPLWFEPQGVALMEDDWTEIFNCDEKEVEQWRFVAFIKALDWIDSRGVWDELVEHFGWPVRMPAWFGKKVEYLDFERCCEELKQAGLGSVATTSRAVVRETGNIFLDYSPEAWDGVMPFTLENVRKLEKRWGEAQVLLDEIEQAKQMAEKDAGVYQRVLDIYERCIVYYDPAKKPRTLVDMWAFDLIQEEEDNEDDEWGG